MHNRLKQFLAAENISQSQFADEIGVARASVSHILAGRNRPGFEFIESMLLHYPALNSEWLITGKGKMYKEATTVHSAPDFSALEKVPELPLAPAPSSPQAPGPTRSTGRSSVAVPRRTGSARAPASWHCPPAPKISLYP